MAFNQANQYSSSPKIFEVLPEPPFVSQTIAAFTYTLGVGLQRELNKHWSIGIGYEFADWGKTALAPTRTELSNDSLSLNHIYTNQLQFSLNFVV